METNARIVNGGDFAGRGRINTREAQGPICLRTSQLPTSKLVTASEEFIGSARGALEPETRV